MEGERRLVSVSLLSGIAIVIYIVESMLPTPSPWLRFGFSHIIILFTLLFFGPLTAILIFLVRTFVGSLVSGRLFSPTFIFGFGGGLIATLLMIMIIYTFRGRGLGIVGISVSGAWINNLVQVYLAYLLTGHRELFLILPVFLLFGVVTGMINGMAVFYLNIYGQNVLKLEGSFFRV